MLIAILAGFLFSLLLVLFPSRYKGLLPFVATALPLGLFIYFITYLPEVALGNVFFYHFSWIPSMGINLDFKVDGLSILFSLLITGIGALVFLYSAAYMNCHVFVDRFYGYLSIFMASMLGLVLSDNLLLLFVFWELTAVSSFFLIGFNNDNKESRRSSLLAWAITGGGGFFLMAGFILMGSLAGTYSIQEMLASSELLKSEALYGVMVFLIFAGAFTKSAQFPFHFWLPGAMKAPTPVSAYLHSATMVKAGVYLIARFTPILGGHMLWNNTLMIIGGITMVYSAFHSILRTDLKGILAYSTISALGTLVFLFGIGTSEALVAASVFIIVHALYKACLFLTTGVVDHETGTRDITQLAGLGKVMLPIAIAAGLAALSSAGIPFTWGFIGKDLVYAALVHGEANAATLTALAVVTNIFLSYSGYLAGIYPFVGKLPERLKDVHLPSVLMWLPPVLLAVCGILFGILPSLVDKSLIPGMATALGITGDLEPLKIWHGFNVVLVLSAVTIAGGVILYFILKPSTGRLEWVLRFNAVSPQVIFAKLSLVTKTFADRFTKFMHNGFLRSYLTKIIVFLVLLVGYSLLRNVEIKLWLYKINTISVFEGLVVFIMIMAVFSVVFSASRLLAIIGVSVVGYCMCLLFVYYGAPDLAMTQFSIDTLTSVLFVLVLLKLPPYLKIKDRMARLRDSIISLSFGLLVAIIALQVLNEPTNKVVSRFYAENAYTMAKGKNVVNVILVDFRGYDTLVEITVLTIAAIGVYTMLKVRASEIE